MTVALPKPAKRFEDRAYRKWLLQFKCVSGSGAPAAEAHHVKSRTDGGMGRKPSDWWCVPLSAEAHRELHSAGEKTFQQKHDIHLRTAARLYWQRYQETR